MPWQISQVWESLQKLFLIDGALFYCISLKKYFSIRIILIDAEIWLKKFIIYSYMSVEVSDKCFKTPIITSCIALQSCSKKKKLDLIQVASTFPDSIRSHKTCPFPFDNNYI